MKRNLAISLVLACFLVLFAGVVWAATTPPDSASSATQTRMTNWFQQDQRHAIYSLANDLEDYADDLLTDGNDMTVGVLTVNSFASLNGAVNFVRDVVTKTSSYVVTVAESGTLYSNMGATAEVTLTLPAAVSGLNYCFYVADAYTMTIDPDDADQVHHLTNAAGDRLQNTGTAGDSVCLTAVDGTYWVPTGEEGTWSDAD